MNLEKMQPSQYSASGEIFNVLCILCNVSVKSTEVIVDTHGKFGDFYCPKCVKTLGGHYADISAL